MSKKGIEIDRSHNFTFLSRHCPKLKIHQWIQLRDVYGFLNDLCQNERFEYAKVSTDSSKPSSHVPTTTADTTAILTSTTTNTDSSSSSSSSSSANHNKPMVKPTNDQFINSITSIKDIENVSNIKKLLDSVDDERKKKIYDCQIKAYHEELQKKKMIIKIETEDAMMPFINMKVHNIVMDILLIERQCSSEEKEHAKKSWTGFVSLVSSSSTQKTSESTEEYGFPNHVYGKNVISDLLQKDKIKFDFFVHYMKNIVKDPDYQLDYSTVDPVQVFAGKNVSKQVLFPKPKESKKEIPVEKHISEIYDRDDPDLDFWNEFEKHLEEINDFEYDFRTIEDLPDSEKRPILDHDSSILLESTSSNSNLVSLDTKYENDSSKTMTKKVSPFCINLQSLAVSTSGIGSQYNQRKFASTNYRSTLFPVTLGIFPYGSISSTGSTHEFVSMAAFAHIQMDLCEMFGPLAFEVPVIILKNLVCSGNIGFRVSKKYLLNTYSGHFDSIRDFSGIRFIDRQNREDKSTILVFEPGKVCSSGTKDVESVIKIFKIIAPMLIAARVTQDIKKVELDMEHSWPQKSTKNLNASMEKKRKRPSNEFAIKQYDPNKKRKNNKEKQRKEEQKQEEEEQIEQKEGDQDNDEEDVMLMRFSKKKKGPQK